MKNMNEQWKSSYLFGSNADFVEELYAQYLDDANSVAPKWQKYFDSIQDTGKKDIDSALLKEKFSIITSRPNYAGSGGELNDAQAGVWGLIYAYRFWGVNYADLDPLTRRDKSHRPELELSNFGLENQLENEFYADYDIRTAPKMKLKDIIARFEALYCGTVGFEYEYISNCEEQEWVRLYIENNYLNYKLSNPEKKQLLQKLTEAEGLEKYLHINYVGQKRFSLEGAESLIPALDRIISRSAKVGVKEVIIGMAHRGRLSTAVNIAGEAPQELIDEFNGKYPHNDFATSGDVKYHKGFACDYITEDGIVRTTIAYNPSHLEVVNPVVNGIVRAKQDSIPDKMSVMGILIHGDSALIGLGTNQGVLNMSQTYAYGVDGMIHITVNNQVGFTTSDIRDNRSSRFCTDIAKMIEAPVLHVNADDVDNVAFVMDMAIAYRTKFAKDIMIDLVGFRRHGHNESDDPTMTQPFMYRKIKEHPGVRTLYANRLIAAGIITDTDAANLLEEYRVSFGKGEHPHKAKMMALPWYDFDTAPILNAKWNDKVDTNISADLIKLISNETAILPSADFKLHPIVAKLFETRKSMASGTQGIDYGMAEILVYGSLLHEGTNVRFSGEDSGRGTFSHRHAIVHNFDRDNVDDKGYTPLSRLENNSKVSIYDSVLNEECVLGFEYGYSTAKLNDLVIWEAQYGDFANGGQVIIDQFITSGEVKWGTLNRLVMMLPHGYDGDGPEHTSARLERYLQLCAENNIQVAIPTTAAQLFHLLRRQIKRQYYIKPLVVLLSKRLLRHKDAISQISDFTNGGFKALITDSMADVNNVNQVIVCSGQVYYDAVKERADKSLEKQVAILRVEQLYPFPLDVLKQELSKYVNASKFVWLQEEPYNQGAWTQLRESLNHCLGMGKSFITVTRPASASPATGTKSASKDELVQLMKDAFK